MVEKEDNQFFSSFYAYDSDVIKIQFLYNKIKIKINIPYLNYHHITIHILKISNSQILYSLLHNCNILIIS